jgi:hypothetical protein
MSDKEAQLARIAADRQRIDQLIENAPSGSGLAVETLRMSLASLDLQETIWQCAREGVETTCSECGTPTRDREEYADDTLCDDCMDAIVAGSQSD